MVCFFGRFENSKNWFWDLLTFTKYQLNILQCNSISPVKTSRHNIMYEKFEHSDLNCFYLKFWVKLGWIWLCHLASISKKPPGFYYFPFSWLSFYDHSFCVKYITIRAPAFSIKIIHSSFHIYHIIFFLITGTKQLQNNKMNFNFSLNETFPGPHNILKIGHDLLPENCHSFTGRNFHILQQRVNDILDTMGNASAR